MNTLWEETQAVHGKFVTEHLVPLLQQSSLPLSRSLKVMGYLKKTPLLSQRLGDLRYFFLTHRLHILERELSVKEAVELRGEAKEVKADQEFKGSREAALKNAIGVTRQVLFDVVTQYLALFREDPASLESPGEGPFDSISESTHAILAMQIMSRAIDPFLTFLGTHLRHVTDASTMYSLMMSAFYLGSSMGRLGFDFKPALGRVFETGMQHLLQSLHDYAWSEMQALPLLKAAANLTTTIASPTAGDSPLLSSSSNTTTSMSPPSALLASPLLAYYANTLVSLLNELRQCPLASLAPFVLELTATDLTALRAILSAAAKDKDKDKEAWSLYRSNLVPFAETAITAMYPHLNTSTLHSDL